MCLGSYQPSFLPSDLCPLSWSLFNVSLLGCVLESVPLLRGPAVWLPCWNLLLASPGNSCTSFLGWMSASWAPCLLLLCSPLPSPGCHADCRSFLRGHVGHGPSKSCLSEGIKCLITSKLPGEKPPCLRIVQPFSPSTAYDLWASRAAVERPKSIWSLDCVCDLAGLLCLRVRKRHHEIPIVLATQSPCHTKACVLCSGMFSSIVSFPLLCF